MNANITSSIEKLQTYIAECSDNNISSISRKDFGIAINDKSKKNAVNQNFDLKGTVQGSNQEINQIKLNEFLSKILS